MHFNPKLHVRADESRKIQDLIQIESSWVLLCDGSHSENIKSLLEERSCQPFRVTKGSSVSSHRSTLPLKTERNRDKCVSAERWERGDPVIPPSREMKPAAASPPANTCATPQPEAAPVFSARVCTEEVGWGWCGGTLWRWLPIRENMELEKTE